VNWSSAVVRSVLAALVLAAASLCFETHAAQPEGSSHGLRAAAAGAESSNAEVVTVIMTEYRFDPDRLSFSNGVRYLLRLENRGTEIHDFSAPGFFQAITLKDPGVLGSSGRSIVVKPGEHKDVEFVPEKPGAYPLICLDHDWAGMRGMIFVK
jgi:plastocyanin